MQLKGLWILDNRGQIDCYKTVYLPFPLLKEKKMKNKVVLDGLNIAVIKTIIEVWSL